MVLEELAVHPYPLLGSCYLLCTVGEWGENEQRCYDDEGSGEECSNAGINLAAAVELTGLLYCYDTTVWTKGSLE
jgi:hypothetical protein